ncbi:DUF1764-domain-containing protein [Anaeromyces robustus]|uniref:DUF1764-domain-containing protein n=1 Tax=Anaeromyces robustus TaxID=1754192 RepID=A0A1Y1WTV8_9FUNG|nr:DUF1764-domain-containing protein [Anaeromyces robustus]|eukprot:ORX76971.1 DUF1764-domain-containing protein [Anaeromyces robustus]
MKANSKINKIRKVEKQPIKKDKKKIESKITNSITKGDKSTKTNDIDLIFAKKKSPINDIDLIFAKKKNSSNINTTSTTSNSNNSNKNGKILKHKEVKKTEDNSKLLSLLETKKSKKKTNGNSNKKEKTSVNDSSKIVVAKSDIKKSKYAYKPTDDDGFGDSRGLHSERRTEDGLRIFTMEDLRIGEGEGDTPLCPFDCNCCF